MKDRTKGNLALLMTAMLWGTGFIAQKLGNEVLPPMTFNALRQVMAGLVLLPMVIMTIRKTRYLAPGYIRNESACDDNALAEGAARRKKRLLLAGVICGIFMITGTMFQQIGLLTVSAGKSGFISACYIVIVPFFSVIVGAKVRKRSVVCILMAMAGFAVMSLQGGLGGATSGDWLTLASAACFAAQIVAVNCYIDEDNAVAISCLQFLIGGGLGLIAALIAEDATLAAVWACMPVLLYSTFLPTALGYTLQIVGQKYTDAPTAALLMSLESVFAVIFGMIFLREMMSPRELAGSAIIFAATIIGQRE